MAERNNWNERERFRIVREKELGPVQVEELEPRAGAEDGEWIKTVGFWAIWVAVGFALAGVVIVVVRWLAGLAVIKAG